MNSLEQNNTETLFAGIDLEKPRDVLSRAHALFGDRLTLASSFSHEDVILIHLLSELHSQGHIDKPVRIFALDTGRLPDETFACAEEVAVRYGVSIDWFYPKQEDLQALTSSKGLYSFRESLENRKECCQIRKVEPLQRALEGYQAWITGQRREQSVTRSSLEVVERRERFKLNPLAHLTYEDVRGFVQAHELPYNKLYDRGYLSVGCAPCTRAVKPGEDERAGRWWWESAEQKECGLHFENGKLIRTRQ